MKKFATWLGVVFFVLGGAVLTFWPVGFWRLYDADWQPLALTNAENYCAGAQGIRNGFQRDDKMTKECAKNTQRDNTNPSITNSPLWACEGIVSGGWGDGSVYDCMVIFHQNDIWLIAGGGLTMSWNEQRPRPQPIDEGVIKKDTRDNRSDGIAPSFSSTETEEGEEE